jgi:hypothetical protein
MEHRFKNYLSKNKNIHGTKVKLTVHAKIAAAKLCSVKLLATRKLILKQELAASILS